MIKRYFVFIKGMREPEGQIFHEYLPMTGEGKKKFDCLFGPVEIQDETLDECVSKFKHKLTEM